MKKKKQVLNKKEKTLVDLALGSKKPISLKDKRLAKQIKEIQDKGRAVEIPDEFLI
jgi:hypothetical protein